MDIDGPILRAARLAAGITTTEMAQRTGLSQTHISKCETGTRRATPDVVDAYIRVLGDTVERRAVMTLLAAAATAGVAAGLPELADLVRIGFRERDEVTDWPEIVARFEAEYAHLPPDLGRGLVTHLMILQQVINERGGTPDLFHAGSSLARLFGLWLANAGRLAQAKGWYETAADLAARSGDQRQLAYVDATVANRGPYERFSERETRERAERALSLRRGPALSTVEAHGAIVHLCGLTGNLPGGRAAAAAMLASAQGLDGDEGQRAVTRALLFRTWLVSRIGPADEAQRAFDEAAPMLRTVQPWFTEARVNLARNRVLHGDPAGGVAEALNLVADYRRDVRVLGIAVRDLVDATPPGYQSEALIELSRYADPDPGPWETFR